MSKTYNDPVKQMTREHARVFIKKNLLSQKRPKDVYVICFPGAEVQGEEALEVREVYDALEIPRKNIIGLEYDLEKAERLENAGLGIQVVCTEDLDFFKRTDKKFDIVSLDYTGQQTASRLDALREVVGRHLLTNRSVLCTNFEAKRLAKKVQNKLLYDYYKGRIFGRFGHEEWSMDADAAHQKLEEFLIKKDADQLDELRKAITYNLCFILRQGKRNSSELDVLRKHPEHDKICELARKAGREEFQKEERIRNHNLLLRAGIISPEELQAVLADPLEYPGFYEKVQKQGLALHVLNETGFTPKTAASIVEMLCLAEMRPYFVGAIERYSYNSNKNSLMFFDLVSLFSPASLFRKLDELVWIEHNYTVKVNPLRVPEKEYLAELDKLGATLVEFDRRDTVITLRHYLGSSYVPVQRKKTKPEKVYALLSGGKISDQEIIAQCGISMQSLAAYKAHQTRRSSQEVST